MAVLSEKKSREVVIRYIDQIIISSVFLGLNIISPYIFQKALASRLMYEASWALLGSVIASACLGTPLLARKTGAAAQDAYSCLIIYGAAGIVLVVLYSSLSMLDDEIWRKTGALVLFSYLWGACDLVRKVALIANQVAISTCLSLGSLCSIAAATAFAWFCDVESTQIIWGIASAGITASLMATVTTLSAKSHLEASGRVSPYFSQTARDSGATLFSFLFGWLATQGMFAIFYQHMNAEEFIETKWAFTLLGIFGVVLAVQENKYQPRISGAVRANDAPQINALLREINRENNFASVVAVALLIAGLIVRPALTVSICVMLACHRQFFALSKTEIYILRANGNFRAIMISNGVACLVGYLLALGAGHLNLNPVAFGLASYSLLVYFLVQLIQNLKRSDD